jgi:hypothetical protein
VTTSWPRYENTIGSRHFARYAARSDAFHTPPAWLTSEAIFSASAPT